MLLSDIGFLVGLFADTEKYPEELAALVNHAQRTYFPSVIDDLETVAPFIKNMGADGNSVPLSVNTNGLATVPDDFAKHISFTFFYDGTQVPVEVLESDDFNRRKIHAIEIPTRQYPIATYAGSTIKFMPKSLQYVNFSYVSVPPDVVYATTIQNGNLVYDTANSVELMWYEQDQIELVRLVLQSLGVIVETEQIKSKLAQK